MDFVMVHSYSRHNRTDMADNSQFSTVETAKLFGKPTYVHTPPKLPLCLALCLSVCRSVCQPVSHTWFTGQVAETGEQTTNDNLFPADPHGIGMHNALWASMASMGAMSSAVWWWDNWVAPNNLCTHRSMGAFALPLTIRSLCQVRRCSYRHFTAVRKFADSVEWPSYVWRPVGHDAPAQCTDTNPDSHNPPK